MTSKSGSSNESMDKEVSKDILFEKDGLKISLQSITDFSSQSIAILLKESKSKSYFLTKSAVTLMFYMACLVLVNFLILFDMVRARIWNRALNMKVFTWVFLSLSIILKFLGGFGNRIFKKVQFLFYFLDVIFTTMAYFGIYWFLEQKDSSTYKYTGHYLLVITFMYFAMTLGFVFSTLVRTPREIYSVTAGFLMMPVFTGTCLIIIRYTWTTLQLRPYEYVLIWLMSFIDTIYLVLEARFMLTLRLKKLYDHEIYYAFFCYNTDIFFSFWVDLFKYRKQMKKKAKKKAKEKKKLKKQKEEAKKMRKELEKEMNA